MSRPAPAGDCFALQDAGLNNREAAEIAQSWVRVRFLLDDAPVSADLVVGNPPYIRSDDLDDEIEAAFYRKRWPTMRGRW